MKKKCCRVVVSMPKKCNFALVPTILLVSCSVSLGQKKPMPKADVIEFPAIGDDLCVNNLFQTNMVVQRDKPFIIKGWAKPGEKVKVSWSGKTVEATAADDRSWKATFAAQPANNIGRVISIQGASKKIELENVVVGDVWVLGGQSNMEWPIIKTENGQLEIVSANYPEIRILTIPKKSSPTPVKAFPRLHEWSSWSRKHFRKGDWDVCTPKSVKEVSAIGYIFARRLHKAANIPIGILDVSVGGTTVETWTPSEVIDRLETEPVKNLRATWEKKFAQWDIDLKDKKKAEKMATKKSPRVNQNRPGNCYFGMMEPLKGLAVKGAIFHQGYNNCFNGTEGAKMYRTIFPQMVTSWRKAFNAPDMPFGILSLCTDGKKQTLQNYSELMSNPGPFIREAQYQTFLEFKQKGDKNIGFVSTYDLRRRWYHPQLKIPAGERIARWALATQYGFGKEIKWEPPTVTKVEVKAGAIHVHFDKQVGGVDDGGAIEGFAVAGKNRKYHPAKVEALVLGKDSRGRPRLSRNVLVLSSAMVSEPEHYRYAWGRNPMGNLQIRGNTDVPMATQRSDDWPLEEVFVDGEVKLIDGRQVKKHLMELDKERAKAEAEELLKKLKK